MKMRKMLAGAMVMLATSFGGLQAQTGNADVAIMNDHLHTHLVLVFDAEGKRHVLGLIGRDEFRTFDVPVEIEERGPYRVALQQYHPLPQLGVPADAPPYKMTPPLELLPGETVAIIVGWDTHLSSVEVVR